jgi:methylenetetrahydrofolate reductase (NADPH)
MATLADKLRAGQTVITSEMPVIDGGGLPEVERQLAPMRDWIDAINATDNTAAHAHASPLAVAIALRQSGVEPIMQLVCRDRNRLALEADIVGAAMHGIENLCCLTGDDVTAGDEPDAQRVFDLDGPGLVALARTLAEGRYLSGRPLEPAPRLLIGAVESATPPPIEARVQRALAKAQAGARFLQLQISFIPELLEEFVAQSAAAGVTERAALLPSVTILGSARGLRFMDEKVFGVDVPAAVIERVESSADQAAACLDLAYEQAAHALSLRGVAGLHLISFRKDAGIAALCTRLGLAPRIEREKSLAHAHDPAVTL